MSVRQAMHSVTAMLTVLTQLETTTATVGLDMKEMVSHVQVDTQYNFVILE